MHLHGLCLLLLNLIKRFLLQRLLLSAFAISSASPLLTPSFTFLGAPYQFFSWVSGHDCMILHGLKNAQFRGPRDLPLKDKAHAFARALSFIAKFN